MRSPRGVLRASAKESVRRCLKLPDDLLDSLRALSAVGSPDALSILKRGAAFWLPELNLKYAKEVKHILKTARS